MKRPRPGSSSECLSNVAAPLLFLGLCGGLQKSGWGWLQEREAMETVLGQDCHDTDNEAARR